MPHYLEHFVAKKANKTKAAMPRKCRERQKAIFREHIRERQCSERICGNAVKKHIICGNAARQPHLDLGTADFGVGAALLELVDE